MTPKELRAHRKTLGLTQPELAHAARVSVTTVCRAERGVIVTLESLDKMERALRRVAKRRAKSVEDFLAQ